MRKIIEKNMTRIGAGMTGLMDTMRDGVKECVKNYNIILFIFGLIFIRQLRQYC